MMADADLDEAKLQLFLQWLQANGGELRGSTIRHCGPSRGFGVFSTSLPAHNNGDGVVMVVPLNLAITPMRVLQDPFLGPRCRALFEEGHIDDRFLIMLFLMVERLRSNSLWKPYLDILPSSFGNPLWFTENELNELKGTTLYRATMLQRKSLQALYQDKVKGLVEELSHSDELQRANSIFWTRALNIPFPHSYDAGILLENNSGDETSKSVNRDPLWVEGLVPGIDFCNHVQEKYNMKTSYEEQDKESSFLGGDYGASVTQDAGILLENNSGDETSKSVNRDPLWVEGLVPGIDFCNHGVDPGSSGHSN
ncbi:Ribulose-1,5 bisphosphate carboxylase/oxygenase large subunit N-methyltransferase, chloroplastic, partial [Ananas comosus]